MAQAVIAYAANCDNLGALGDAVELITEKHVSLHIQPEQYLIVGKCLLKAIKEILGDIATEEILNEWKTAIFFLAGILIEVEKKKYEAQIVQKGKKYMLSIIPKLYKDLNTCMVVLKLLAIGLQVLSSWVLLLFPSIM